MKSIFFVLTVALLFTVSCASEGGQDTTVTTSDTAEATTTTTTNEESTEAEVPAMNETKVDRTTLEGFWALFQEAVKAKNASAVEALYSEGAEEKRLFSEEDDIQKISASKVADVSDTGQIEEGEKVYQFMMMYQNGETESATILSIKKNMDGEFEIFNVLDAG